MNCEKECNKCNESINESVIGDYKEMYYNLQDQYKNLAKENEGLKKAVIKLASI